MTLAKLPSAAAALGDYCFVRVGKDGGYGQSIETMMKMMEVESVQVQTERFSTLLLMTLPPVQEVVRYHYYFTSQAQLR